MRTLFLQAPSFDGFDGGAGARYQTKREVASFWYPTWLAQPAALVAYSKLIDAPPHNTSMTEVAAQAKNFDLAVVHTSTPSFSSDVKVITALKDANPALKVGLIGAKAAVDAELLYSRHKVSPYLGQRLMGLVEATLLRGQLVYDGERQPAGPVGMPILGRDTRA